MPAKPTPAANGGVNFGDLNFYTGGFNITEGNYILFFNVINLPQQTKTGQPMRGAGNLAVKVDFYHKDDPTEETKLEKFYGMGSKAHLSYVPNPDTGKGVVPVPGGPGGGMNDSTNWAMLLKSLYDCGLPQGVFTNDLTVLDGVHCHITLVDESAERAAFRSNKTAEVQATPQAPSKVPVVTEIFDDGKPWEGSGGLPKGKTPAKAPAPKPGPTPVAKPAPTSDSNGVADDVLTAAGASILAAITKNPNGGPRILIRNGTLAHARKAHGEEMATKIIDNFFEGSSADENLSKMIGEWGYTVQGTQIQVAS